MKIALLGLGTVGQGVYDIIFNKKAFSEVEIKYVLIKNLNKKRKIAKDILTNDFSVIINDSEISVVIEVMGTLDLAYNYIKQALINKKSVVTANKEVMAIYLEELTNLATENNVSLYFEASVGGGIPIINNLMNISKTNQIIKIEGILNGTTNYILSKMQEKSLTFADVLKEAQELGFAECDSKNDLEGYDMARKIAILSQLGFKNKINYDDIECYSINGIEERIINYAYRSNYVVKFLATATKKYMAVEPVLLPINGFLANVSDEYNCVLVEGDIVGKLAFYGKGAGDFPTANAICADLLKIIENIKSSSFKLSERVNKEYDWGLKQYLIAGKDIYITKPIDREELKKIECSFYARIEEE